MADTDKEKPDKPAPPKKKATKAKAEAGGEAGPSKKAKAAEGKAAKQGGCTSLVVGLCHYDIFFSRQRGLLSVCTQLAGRCSLPKAPPPWRCTAEAEEEPVAAVSLKGLLAKERE